MTRITTSLTIAVVLAATLAHVSPARAVKIEAADDVFLKINYLLQPYIVLDANAAHDPAYTSDFYIRRSRIMLHGQVSPYVTFFMETDMPNWGKDGDWTTPTFFVQDAYVEFNIHDGFKVSVGMLLIPFVHQANQGATSLHTLDYHGGMIRYPAGSHKVWRDNGFMVRGLLLNKHLDYRFAVTNGVPGTAHDIPRFSGHLRASFFDPEEGMFYGGTYLGKKKVLSVGAAFDAQPQAFGEESDYIAVGADVFMDIPLGRNRISGQVDYVLYGGSSNPDRGMGVLMDLGVAFDKVEPIVAFDWFAPHGASSPTDHLIGGHAGVNWWIVGHKASIKLDLGMVKPAGGDGGDLAKTATIQTQLLL